jgi:predicted transglutaminase-like cysteine proteinase
MNLSKKMIACAALVIALFTVSSAYAQGGGRMDTAATRQRTEARIAKAKTDLNLTQVQADSLKAITMEFNAKRRDIFMDPANQGLSREDRMAKMQPLTDAMNARVKAAFGDDLYKKYQDWEQQNRPQRN